MHSFTSVGGMISAHIIYESCKVRIGDRELLANLIILDTWDFDIILGMD